MKLYSYWRSSCAYRVRIALGLKKLDYQTVPVNLLKSEQIGAENLARNPLGRVPTLELDDGTELAQSLAIMSWLDATFPDPPLLPPDPLVGAKVRAAAHVIAVDTQPLTNSGTLARLTDITGADAAQIATWQRSFMSSGLVAFQNMIHQTGSFAFGETPTLADICLVPQLYNARRWEVDLAPLARLVAIEQNCLTLPAFDAARPENQPDAA